MNLIRQILSIILFLSVLQGFAQQIEHHYAADINHFKELDSINPPPLHAILFAGSSSFTRWPDVQDYFPDYIIINRAFGGSTLLDQIFYVDDVIMPYSPHQIVLYCGENDFAYNDSITVDSVTATFIRWFKLVRIKLPDVNITYVSMKPSPSRWYMKDKFIAANKNIENFLKTQENTGYISIWGNMLNANHLPEPTLFISDSLHMNANGYKIWQQLISPELIK
jgi:lysophospholipase L1-like esterase